MKYYEIYKQRVNRFGNTYQTRIQGAREKQFELYLNKSVYKTYFNFNNIEFCGSFERYKQDDTKTLHYLLTNIHIEIPNGSVIFIKNNNCVEEPWMVWYLEDIKASGYNRYIMLRMTHYISWKSRDGSIYNSWAYMYGQENNMLKDELKSRSRMDTVYDENLKSSFFILPVNANLLKDDYLIIGEKPLQEYYRVTGYDRQSSEGVEYVTVDPVYEYDQSPPPVKPVGDDSKEYYWFDGGING